MLTKKEAQQKVEQYTQLFQPLLNVPIRLTFGKFNIEQVVITELRMPKVSEITIDKRIKPDGNGQYTPLVMEIVTNEGKLLFIIEDAQVAAIVNGIRIDIGTTKVEMRKM